MRPSGTRAEEIILLIVLQSDKPNKHHLRTLTSGHLVLSVTILRNGAKRQCEPPSAHWDVVRLCLKVYSGAHSSGRHQWLERSVRSVGASGSCCRLLSLVWRAVLHRTRRRRTARCATLLVALLGLLCWRPNLDKTRPPSGAGGHGLRVTEKRKEPTNPSNWVVDWGEKAGHSRNTQASSERCVTRRAHVAGPQARLCLSVFMKSGFDTTEISTLGASL